MSTLKNKIRGIGHRMGMSSRSNLKKEFKDSFRDEFYPPISHKNSRRMAKEFIGKALKHKMK